MFNCFHPIYFPLWLPQQFSRGTKKRRAHKKVSRKNVLIPSTNACYLTIAGYDFFLGAYGSLPDAAIWWCLRTGGGGVLTSCAFDCTPYKDTAIIGKKLRYRLACRKKHYSFCKQIGQCPRTNYVSSLNGFKMG